MTLKFDGWHQKIIGHLFYTTSSFVHNFKSIGELKLKLLSGSAQFRSKSEIFFPCDLELWRMTFKTYRAHLCYFTLCASFHDHWWIQTGVTVRKRSIPVKIGDFLSRVTLNFDGWPWKTIGHLFCATLSFVHHFKAIGEFKLKLESGNAQFGSKLVIFFVPCDLEIWRMTFENNRAHLLCYFTLCASFHDHWWIQTGVTVRKRPIWVKIDDFY